MLSNLSKVAQRTHGRGSGGIPVRFTCPSGVRTALAPVETGVGRAPQGGQTPGAHDGLPAEAREASQTSFHGKISCLCWRKKSLEDKERGNHISSGSKSKEGENTLN